MNRRKVTTVFEYIVLTIIAIIFLLPTLWCVLAAFDVRATSAIRLPETWSLLNFKEVLKVAENRQGFVNSTMICGGQVAIVLICSLMAAYPLSRYNLKNGNRITQGLLFLTAIPATGILVPVYRLMVKLGLIDTKIGVTLLLAAGALPYAIWMMKNFLDSVPVELEEAAWIDGCSKKQGLLRVVLPLMVPGVFTVTIYTFVQSWGNFYTPYVLLYSSNNYTASVNIFRTFGDHGIIIYGELAAYSLLYTLPIFVLYSFSQKYMSKGFTMQGAAKG